MEIKQTNLLIVALILTGFAISCSMFGGSNANSNSNAGKATKGLAATAVCQLLAHPDFESKFPYDGKGCSGSTTFGARDMRTRPSETDTRAAFSYAVIGENDKIERIMLSMSNHQGGAGLLAAEATMVAKMIDGQPLPKEIENAVNASYSAYTSRSQDWKIGDVKVNLFRTSDSTMLSFEF